MLKKLKNNRTGKKTFPRSKNKSLRKKTTHKKRMQHGGDMNWEKYTEVETLKLGDIIKESIENKTNDVIIHSRNNKICGLTRSFFDKIKEIINKNRNLKTLDFSGYFIILTEKLDEEIIYRMSVDTNIINNPIAEVLEILPLEIENLDLSFTEVERGRPHTSDLPFFNTTILKEILNRKIKLTGLKLKGYNFNPAGLYNLCVLHNNINTIELSKNVIAARDYVCNYDEIKNLLLEKMQTSKQGSPKLGQQVIRVDHLFKDESKILNLDIISIIGIEKDTPLYKKILKGYDCKSEFVRDMNIEGLPISKAIDQRKDISLTVSHLKLMLKELSTLENALSYV